MVEEGDEDAKTKKKKEFGGKAMRVKRTYID